MAPVVRRQKKLFGKRRKDVGGRGPELAEATKPRLNTDIEPVFFHGWPEPLYCTLLKDYPEVKAVCDWTPQEAILANLCAQLGVMYWGLAISEYHANQLYKRLQYLYFLRMALPDASEDVKIHEPALAKLLGPKNDQGRNKEGVEGKKKETAAAGSSSAAAGTAKPSSGVKKGAQAENEDIGKGDGSGGPAKRTRGAAAAAAKARRPG